MKLYLSGPMSNLPEFNYAAFNAEASRLRALGHEVENPAEGTPPPCGTYQGYMRSALRRMLTCDVVATLSGYKESRGARIETDLAAKLAIPVMPASDFISPVKSFSGFVDSTISTIAAHFGATYEDVTTPIDTEPRLHIWPELNPSISRVR